MTKPDLPRELLWLLDAPMFIDERQVDAFYDAAVRPDYEGTGLVLSDSIGSETTFGGEVTAGAAVPWLVKAKATVRADEAITLGRERERTLKPVTNTYRHLLTLALHYATELPRRVVVVQARESEVTAADATGDAALEWQNDEFIQRLPRALAFIEIPPETPLIPAALELTNGEVKLLLNDLARALLKSGSGIVAPPRYPGSSAPQSEHLSYWKWFTDHFDDREALNLVESAVHEHKIAWIAYRVPLAGVVLHLHIAGRGLYDTGTFAYNFISRGYKHGIRLVGTLKSEPDLNVLALFER